MTEEAFEARYVVGEKESHETPMLWDDGVNMIINDAVSKMLNENKIPHVILIGQSLLDYLGRITNPVMSGLWVDPRSNGHVKTVTWQWIESSFREGEQQFEVVDELGNPTGKTDVLRDSKGGIKLTINDREKYVWMVNHNNPDDFDLRLDAWKARWPD